MGDSKLARTWTLTRMVGLPLAGLAMAWGFRTALQPVSARDAQPIQYQQHRVPAPVKDVPVRGEPVDTLEERVGAHSQGARHKQFIDWNSLHYIPEEEVRQDLPDYADPNNSGNALFRVDDPNVYVSENFTLKEFARTNGVVQPYMRLDKELVESLQHVRERLGKPVHVIGGYRTASRQLELNPRSPKSRHRSGDAVDIYVHGMSPDSVAEIVKDVFGADVGLDKIGLGVYADKGTVHVDARGYKVRW